MGRTATTTRGSRLILTDQSTDFTKQSQQFHVFVFKDVGNWTLLDGLEHAVDGILDVRPLTLIWPGAHGPTVGINTDSHPITPPHAGLGPRHHHQARNVFDIVVRRRPGLIDSPLVISLL